MAKLEEVKQYDPNSDESGAKAAAMLPTQHGTFTMDGYVQALETPVQRAPSILEKAAEAFQKALSTVPQMFTYARISVMPDQSSGGNVVERPGIAFNAIAKIARENIAPQLIIGMRVDDVLRYSSLSDKPWRPGWQICPRVPEPDLSDATKREIRQAEAFLENSNVETGYAKARTRDKHHLTDFQRFLAAAVRDTLTYDALAVFTKMDMQGKVIQYALLPGAQIRLCTEKGYNNDPDQFAVAVDEGNKVLRSFSRDELVYYVRNPRTDPDVFGYGYPEIEIAMRLVQGFQNVVEYNVDIFNRAGVPSGMLVLSGGGWLQKQLDVLSRIWGNLQRGITKKWALPVMAAPKDGKVELVDFSKIKGDEALYQDLLNLTIGAFCVVFRFPVNRLGYKTSGRGPDSKPNPDSQVDMVDADDPGLAPLLTHLERLINEYLVWSRWPNLVFRFNGKNPKEDSREYEAKKLSRTWKESRAEAGLPKLDQISENKEFKDLVEILELCPEDPNKSNVFQTVVSEYFKAKEAEKAREAMEGQPGPGKDPARPGNLMNAKKDPARSEQHGAISGVRRDSAAETKKD